MKFDFSRLKSIDLNQFLRQSKSIDLKTVLQANKLIAVGLASILLVVVYVFSVFLPASDAYSEKKALVNNIPQMEQNISLLAATALKTKQNLDNAKQEYDSLNELFSVDSEIEEVYKQLGRMAASYSLVIASLNKESDEPVYPNTGAQDPQAGQQPGAKPSTPPLFYRIKLKADLVGSFSKYLQFREAIASYSKRINFDKEQISVVEGNTKGLVQVRLQISTFRLPNKLSISQFGNSSPYALGAREPALLMVFIEKILGINQAVAQESAAPVAAPSMPKGSVSPPIPNPAIPQEKDSRNKYERDPFSKSTSGMVDTVRDPRVSTLLMANTENYTVIGTVVGDKHQTAIIKTDLKESFIVKVGDRLGNKGGTISKITADSVFVKQNGEVVKLYLQSPTGIGSSESAQ